MNTTKTAPAIDEHTFRLLQDLMGEEGGFQEIIQLFRDETQASLEALIKSIDNQQPAIVGGICHRLKSSSRLIGAVKLAELVSKLEEYSNHKDQISAGSVLDQTQEEFSRVVIWLDSQHVFDG